MVSENTDMKESGNTALKAIDFKSREVYRSSQTPGYTAWVSFFPGERGQWYITCEEVSRPDIPLPQCTLEQSYEMAHPAGYDKSQYLMEAVILESTDDMQTWNEISRQPYHHHHSVTQFATARTTDGRFLRFIWAAYSLESSVKTNEIFYTSDDNGNITVGTSSDDGMLDRNIDKIEEEIRILENKTQ